MTDNVIESNKIIDEEYEKIRLERSEMESKVKTESKWGLYFMIALLLTCIFIGFYCTYFPKTTHIDMTKSKVITIEKGQTKGPQ